MLAVLCGQGFPAAFWQWGSLSPKYTQNKVFSLTIAPENCMILGASWLPLLNPLVSIWLWTSRSLFRLLCSRIFVPKIRMYLSPCPLAHTGGSRFIRKRQNRNGPSSEVISKSQSYLSCVNLFLNLKFGLFEGSLSQIKRDPPVVNVLLRCSVQWSHPVQLKSVVFSAFYWNHAGFEFCMSCLEHVWDLLKSWGVWKGKTLQYFFLWWKGVDSWDSIFMIWFQKFICGWKKKSAPMKEGQKGPPRTNNNVQFSPLFYLSFSLFFLSFFVATNGRFLTFWAPSPSKNKKKKTKKPEKQYMQKLRKNVQQKLYLLCFEPDLINGINILHTFSVVHKKSTTGWTYQVQIGHNKVANNKKNLEK